MVVSALALFSMYGITFAIKDASLLTPFREWVTSRSSFMEKMLSCSFCTGFHSGWISFFLLYFSGLTPPVERLLPALLVYSFCGASFSYLMDILLLRIESEIT